VATRQSLREELERRLGDTANAVWSDAQLNGFIDNRIKALYPTWFRRDVAITLADDGPVQTMPARCRNLYEVGLKRSTSTRVRRMRGWNEGDGQALVPKTGIEGETLVWSWTKGWDAPVDDTTTLTIPVEAEEAVLLSAHISALENILTDRVSVEKYHALQVRQGITEDDVATAIDALLASYREHVDNHRMTLPEVVR